MDNIIEQVENQEQVLQELEKQQPVEIQNEIMYIYKMELERVRYIIQSYLRVRILKLQNFVFYVVKEDLASKLSNEENKFIEGFYKLKTLYFKKQFLQTLPSLFRDIAQIKEQELDQCTNENPSQGPNQNFPVLARAYQDIGLYECQIQDTQEFYKFDVKQGDVILAPYTYIKQALTDGNLQIV